MDKMWKLFEDPNRWAQNTYAQTIGGRDVSSLHKKLISFVWLGRGQLYTRKGL